MKQDDGPARPAWGGTRPNLAVVTASPDGVGLVVGEPARGEPTRRRDRVGAVVGWVLAAVAIVLVVRQGLAVDWGDAWARARGANPWMLLLAIAVFYLTYPVRALRWRILLANAGVAARSLPSTRELTGIMYRAAFVNSVGVARVGDVFRANLLKRNGGGSQSVALGTVVSERLLDLATLAVGVAVGALLFLDGTAASQVGLFALLGLGAILAAGIALVVANRHRAAAERFVPTRFRPALARLLDGVAGSLKRLPLLAGFSVAGWALEGLAVYLVAAAVGTPLTVGAAVVVGLVAALLSAIPITPSGLGFTEAGVGVLLVGLGVGAGSAAAIVVLVRLVSYWSIVLLGGAGALARRSF